MFNKKYLVTLTPRVVYTVPAHYTYDLDLVGDSLADATTVGYFPSSYLKAKDFIYLITGGESYFYIASESDEVISLANALANYNTSDATFPTWTGTPEPGDAGYGVPYSYDLSTFLTDADSISISGGPSWMSVSGMLLVGTPDAVATTTNIVITPTNTNGDGPTKTVSVTVNALAPEWDSNTPVISWVAASDPDHDFTQYINSDGGDATITYGTSGLPADLTLNTVSPGVTDGTLSAAAGGYAVPISATNSAGTSIYVFGVTITEVPVVVATWGVMPDLDWIVGQTINIYMPTYIIDGGGENPEDTDAFTYAVDADIPDDVVVSGLWLTGEVQAGEEGSYTPVFTATNSAGGSNPASPPDITVTEAGDTTGVLLDNLDTGAGWLFENPVTDFTPRAGFFLPSQDVNEADGNVTVTLIKLGAQDQALNQNIILPTSAYLPAGPVAANIGAGETSKPVVLALTETDQDDSGQSAVLSLSANSATDGNTTTTINITDSHSSVTSAVQFAVTNQQGTEGVDPVILIERVGGGTEALTQDIVVPANSGYLVAADYPANLAEGVNSEAITLTGAAISRSGDQGGSGLIPLRFTANPTGNSTLNYTVNDSDPAASKAPSVYSRFVTFQNFSVGDSATDPLGQDDTSENDRFDWNADATNSQQTITNVRGFAGSTQCARLSVLSGSTGFAGRPGFNWPDRPWVVGTEIWLQCRVFYDQAYITAEAYKYKFIRLGMTSGQFSTLWQHPQWAGGIQPTNMSWSGDNDPSLYTFNLYNESLPNRWDPDPHLGWNTYEIYIEVSHTSAGVVRIWKDHYPLKGENLVYPSGPHVDVGYVLPAATVRTSGDSLKGANEVFGYFNGDPDGSGAPFSFTVDTDAWVCVVNPLGGSVVPGKTDPVSGFPFIGPWEND